KWGSLGGPLNGLNVTFTICLLMHGKEVGSIIGKKGESVEKMLKESGTCINLLEGNCPQENYHFGWTC
uniref:K Homology domain-containing protein n=1 Tax=Marmota marmota marmota TaxID=9994 RepID=A0A8C5ZJ62_MARMA